MVYPLSGLPQHLAISSRLSERRTSNHSERPERRISLGATSQISYMSCAPPDSPTSMSTPTSLPMYDKQARRTMDELHALGNAIGSGDTMPLTAEQELRSLIRWDNDVATILDTIKIDQLQLMRAGSAASVAEDTELKVQRGSNVPQSVAGGLGSSSRLSSRRPSTVPPPVPELARVRGSMPNYMMLTDTSALTRPRRFIFAPKSMPRLALDLLATALVWYLVISVPLETFVLPEWGGWLALDMVADLLLVLDVLMNFVTAYEDRHFGILIFEPRAIAKRYVRSWMLVDVLSLAPLDYALRGLWTAPSTDGGVNVGRLMRVIRLINLSRWLPSRQRRTVNYDNGSQDVILFNPSIVTLVYLIMSLLCMWHYVACIYFHISGAQLNSRADPATLFRGGAFPPPALLAASGSGVRYVHAYYWAVIISTQVTDPLPDTVGQLVLSLVVTLGGVLVLSLIIGAATTVVGELQAQHNERRRHLQRILRYTLDRRLPSTLRRRIVSFYAFNHSSIQMDEKMLAGLPRSLKLQIDVVRGVPHAARLKLDPQR